LFIIKQHKKEAAVLPATIEWHHCKGSTEIYRGYPCALWTIFHILTVNQLKLYNSQTTQEKFDVKECIYAIRLFVLNFFSCKECSDNFNKETQDWQNNLNKKNDAVLYLWKVHNSVNKRLSKEEGNDPMFPKKLFPSKQQCQKCYLDNENNQNTNSSNPFDESLFDLNEVFNFLINYYSKEAIEISSSLALLDNQPVIKF
jgi:thiol oxidase